MSIKILCLIACLTLALSVSAEESDTSINSENNEINRSVAPNKTRRKYVTDHPERTDAGIFYAAAAVGGNFYSEPEISLTTGLPTGNAFKEFGYSAGAYFDYDYSAVESNIPLALRGFVGYKYILRSVHCFTFQAIARRMIQFSERVTFGIGLGADGSIWYRPVANDNDIETWSFVPSFVVEAGFDFNPFMVDFKALINRIADNNSTLGFEMYFGFRF